MQVKTRATVSLLNAQARAEPPTTSSRGTTTRAYRKSA